MKTETLAANLRNAISSGDKYHIELYGEEACRRLVQQKDALDALQAQRDAARAAVMERRDTKPTADETAREAELQQLAKERDWLYNEWMRVLDELGYGEDAERIIDRDDDSADAPSTVVLDELWKHRVTTTALCSEVARMEPEPAKEPEPERGTCDNCKWFERDESSNSYEWDGECHS